MKIVDTQSETHGIKASCESLEVSRATWYRRRKRNSQVSLPEKKRSSFRKLSDEEERQIIAVLSEEHFADMSVAEVYAQLLDSGKYLASIRTFYRILSRHHAVHERRSIRRHKQFEIPRLCAKKTNQVWSWDITKLKGPGKWEFYYLYVIIDIYSRYVVGWLLAERESDTLAEELISQTCAQQIITRDSLTIHADRGPAMRSHKVSKLFSDLAINKSHSRPRVSNDNAYSESQFKTMKYRPEFPARFGSIQDARAFLNGFFNWYNREHHHSGIALMTPEVVHSNQVQEVLKSRFNTMQKIYHLHPERFVKGTPVIQNPPKEVWINKPVTDSEIAV